VTEKGAALGIGTLAALVTAVPAVPRVTAEGANAAFACLALLGGTALVLGPSLVLATSVPGTPRGLRASLHGLGLAATPLSLLASALKAGTHHRPLGAATFAVLALGTLLAFVLVSWRILAFAEARDSRAGRATILLLALAALASTAFVVVRALAAPALVPHVLDGLRALSTASLAYLLLRFPRTTRVFSRVGGPLWVAVVVAGLVSVRDVAAAVRSAAPVLGGPVTWL
jgi:hypothetical protein